MSTALPMIDRRLLAKYQAAAPRYTSYPPANRFKEDFDRQAVHDLAVAAARSYEPASLYVHLPFCRSQCWYCGCNTIITRSASKAARYLDYLDRELALVLSGRLNRKLAGQVHFGGGTPNFLTPEEIGRLGEILGKYITLTPDYEFGVELDPRYLTEEQVKAFRAIGCNRASIGIQDVEPKVQLAIHRWQPESLNRRAVDWLRAAGFRSVNVDLILGLPAQTTESFERTLDSVLALSPDRLSLFGYAHIPWLKPAQAIFDRKGQLPSTETRLELYCASYERLIADGFVDIGLDHFARPEDDLALARSEGRLHRNFQGYSTAAGLSLIGVGISSISSDKLSYRQNHKTLEAWEGAIDRGTLPIERALVLNEDDLVRRAVIMRIMCNRSVDYAELSEELGVDAMSYFSVEIESLTDLEEDGVLKATSSGFEILPAGFPLLRIVAMRFDGGLSAKVAARHSLAI